MNFFQRTPFLFLLLFLISGIILFQFIQLPSVAVLTVATISLLAVVLTYILQNKVATFRYRWSFGASAACFLLVVGYGSCVLFQERHSFNELNEKAIYEVELRSAPIEKARSFVCKVELKQKFDSAKAIKCSGFANLYLQKDSAASQLVMGDRILVEAEFQLPDGVQNPDGFDYATYLKRHGIGATAYISSEKWKKLDSNPTFSFSRLADQSRLYLLNIYRKFKITGDEFAVLAALTLGYTDALQPDLLKSYSATGATHILSVSGLHVGIVYAVIFFLLGFLNKSKRQKIVRVVITTLFIWMYAILTGLSPAVLRAAMMMSFIAVGTCLDRNSQIFNTILLSAFFLLLFNPFLLFDIGFQLSYVAVISIVFFQPKISKLIYVKNKPLKWLWDLTAVSIAAQIGTFPFILYYFHQFPNYFLLTNYVAIPISTIIIYLAIALLFLSKIPVISTAIAFLLKWSLWMMNWLIAAIQNLPGSISVISVNALQLVLIFAFIIAITAFYYNKKFSALTAGLVSLLLVFCIYNYQKFNSLNNSRMIVFSDSRVPVINFIDNGNNYVFTTDSLQAEKTASAFWKSNLLKKPIYLKNENSWFTGDFVSFKNKRILILKDDFLKNKISEKPIELDYLILSNKIKPKMEEILACVQPKNVIIDKSISKGYTNYIERVCKQQRIQYYSIAENGAYIVTFAR